MKTITARDRDLILEVTGEGLTSLPAAVLEKDLLITEILQRMTGMDTGAMKLVFCGGTCLSKAHGLIERMSEDIDFKVIVPEGLSRTARSKRLSWLKKQVVDFLCGEGFTLSEQELIARDENNYVSLNIRYASHFASVASLRPEIKVELSARSPLLPVEHLPIRSILGMMVDPASLGISVECLGVQETLGEKILSFLRRTAEAMAGRNRAEYDDRLIRHLYDVSVILHSRTSLAKGLSAAVFQQMIVADGVQFSQQYPEFRENPSGEMRKALERLKSDEGFALQYNRFVDELVYGDPITFAVARRDFIMFAERFLPGMTDINRGDQDVSELHD